MNLPPKHPRSDRASAGPARAGLLLLALLAACRSAGGGHARPPAEPAPVVTLSAAGAEPLFEALRSALAEGEDELAERLVAGLRTRALNAREQEIVAGAERVLAGRRLVRALEFQLASEPVQGSENAHTLFLVARSRATEPVRLQLPPSDLKRLRGTIDARGVEGFEYESRACEALSELVLAPGVERRVELIEYELPLGRALAVRERWRLETRSGEIHSGDTAYPAANVRVASCERERLSPLLAPGPAAETALAEALAASEPPAAQALLELALRTPRAARGAALAALAPVVARLAREAPERVQRSEPALRWLTQNRDLGPDAAAWARYLDARVAAGEHDPSAPAGGLDLPAPRRDERESQ